MANGFKTGGREIGTIIYKKLDLRTHIFLNKRSMLQDRAIRA